MKRAHKDQVLDFMAAGNEITGLTALARFHCMRLGARIYDLRQQGHKIRDYWLKLSSGKRIKAYYMGAIRK